MSDNGKPQAKWAIVGGGMLGLTLAHRLAQQGQRVTVYEAGAEIGGLAGAWQLGGVQWDKHYHVTLLSDLRLRALLSELGLEQEMRWVETKTGFYTDGQLYSMSNSWEFLRFPPLGLIDKLRLGGTIFAASKRKDWQTLEQTLVGDWLQKWSGKRTFEKIWRPLLEAKLGDAYQRTSAAFIWATIARMYKARQSGLKKEMFGYLPGGYARILQRFAESIEQQGVELLTDSPIAAVIAQPDGKILVKSTGPAQQYAANQFDRAVLTTPSSMLPQLCPQLDDEQRKQHERIEYLGILCASVVLRKPLASYYVTNITDGWAPFTAVIEMTTLVDPAELGGKHLVYLPRYVAADDEAWQWSDEELQQRFIEGLKRMYPRFSPADVVAFRVSRARSVMALPTLNYSQRLPPQQTSLHNMFAVNSAQIVKGTLNVNEVVELAESACKEVLLPSLNEGIDAPVGDLSELSQVRSLLPSNPLITAADE